MEKGRLLGTRANVPGANHIVCLAPRLLRRRSSQPCPCAVSRSQQSTLTARENDDIVTLEPYSNCYFHAQGVVGPFCNGREMTTSPRRYRELSHSEAVPSHRHLERPFARGARVGR
jgi:hypothetical protein